MKGYDQLSVLERFQIDAGISMGLTLAEIARRLGRPRSTVFRELKRNGHLTREGYSASHSRSQYEMRRKKCRPRFKIQGDMKRWIDLKICEKWSPEQIVGRARLEKREIVGVETIYRYIYRDRLEGGQLWQHLRHTRKKRKKRFPAKRWPKALPRTPLEKRPVEANERSRIGDYERDLIVGSQQKGYLLTIVDRKTRFVKIRKIARPTGALVHQATLHALRGQVVNTLTNDNGCEFISYAKTSRALHAPVFFTRPYASWERGTVENMNKLIRQFVPKKSFIQEIPHEQIKMVEMVLNRRPRKNLGYRTPAEAYFQKYV